MKYTRVGCVMGGMNEREQNLNSVEGFKFDRYTWEELPGMHEARMRATAVVC